MILRVEMLRVVRAWATVEEAVGSMRVCLGDKRVVIERRAELVIKMEHVGG